MYLVSRKGKPMGGEGEPWGGEGDAKGEANEEGKVEQA